MSIRTITDSTSYLTKEFMQGLSIKVLSLNISFKDETLRELETGNDEFYKKMAEKGIPTSSQPPVGEIFNEMNEAVQAGDSVCCVVLSSHMSGTFSTANMAKNMILETNPEAQIEVIDSKSNSMQLGFAAMAAAKAAAKGLGLSEVVEAVLNNIKRSRFLFIPDNLEYLRKGGRIGNAGALIGNFLKIIPVLTVDDGKTSIMTKVRTKKNAVLKMIEKMMADINEYGLGEIIVHHINCYDEALELVALIKEKIDTVINIMDIGPVIGLHVGPGAVGIVYYTKRDMR